MGYTGKYIKIWGKGKIWHPEFTFNQPETLKN